MVNLPALLQTHAPRLLDLWERTGLDSLHRLANGRVPFDGMGNETFTQSPGSRVDRPQADGDQIEEGTAMAWLGTGLMDAFKQTRDREILAFLFELHESFFRQRLRFQIRRMGGRLDIDDVLQEAMLNVLRYPHRFAVDKADSFRVWMSMILRNTVLKQMRSLSRATRMGSLEAEFGEDSVAVQDPRMPTPLRRAADAESARRVDRAFLMWLTLYHAQFRDLSERERFALTRVEIDQWSYREVAEALEIRVENLKMVIFRARRKILRGLAETLARMTAVQPVETHLHSMRA